MSRPQRSSARSSDSPRKTWSSRRQVLQTVSPSGTCPPPNPGDGPTHRAERACQDLGNLHVARLHLGLGVSAVDSGDVDDGVDAGQHLGEAVRVGEMVPPEGGYEQPRTTGRGGPAARPPD